MNGFPVFGKADDVLDYMGHTFVETRRKSLTNAWRFYLECLFHYQKQLRDVIGIEVIIERGMKIEDFIKDSKNSGGRKNLSAEDKLEVWAEFLGSHSSSSSPTEDADAE